jgi:hypothetical protein
MPEAKPTEIAGVRDDPGSLRTTLYRYFFYGWLFRDANHGSDLERAAALRHNRASARWLLTYVLRWVIGGAVILAFELSTEQGSDNAPLSAALAIALVGVIVFLVVTILCWTALRLEPRR